MIKSVKIVKELAFKLYVKNSYIAVSKIDIKYRKIKDELYFVKYNSSLKYVLYSREQPLLCVCCWHVLFQLQ